VSASPDGLSPALVSASRRPFQAAAACALLAADAIAVVRCDTDARILAALAGLAALALLVPALKWNRGTLPFAVTMGAVPPLLSLRARAFPSYDVTFAGLLLLVCAECASRAWYVHSTAPRQIGGRWTAHLAALVLGGATASLAVVVLARWRLHGAVLLTAIGAGALAVAGLLASRSSEE